MVEARRKSAAKANMNRGKNGIIRTMNNRDKSALALALAIVGGIAAGMRCDASVTLAQPRAVIGRCWHDLGKAINSSCEHRHLSRGADERRLGACASEEAGCA